MHILIDSSEYKKDRTLSKKDFSLIKDLGNRDLITNHISWFVYKECTSSAIDESKIKIKESISSLNSLSRLGIQKNEISISEGIIKKLVELDASINLSIENLWNEFIKNSKSIFHKFDKECSKEVFENYFLGEAPFSKLKSRNDIPDAFIYETIKKISSKNELTVLTSDKKFKESLEVNLTNVIVYSSFDELNKNSEFLKLMEKYKLLIHQEEKLNFIIKYLKFFNNEIEKEVSVFIDNINYIEFKDSSLLSDDNSAMIQYLYNPKLNIKFEEIEIIDNDAFIPITVSVDADIDYAIFKADYWMYESPPKYSDEIDKYYLIEESVKLNLMQYVVIDLDDVELETNEDDGHVPFVLNEFETIEMQKNK